MQLVDDAGKAWKWLSMWAFIVIGAMPDIYAGLQGLGWLDDKAVPASFVWTIRGLAALGIAVRLVKQQAKAAA